MKTITFNKFIPVLFIWLILISVGNGTLTRRLDLNDLVALSDSVVVGQVIDCNSHWNIDSTTIVTDYELNLQSTSLRVITDSVFQFTVLGGTVDSKVICPADIAILEPGDRVLLFLGGNIDNKLTIMGWQKGVFRLFSESKSASPIILNYSHYPLISTEGDSVTFLTSPIYSINKSDAKTASLSNAITLDEFFTTINSIKSRQQTEGYRGPYEAFIMSKYQKEREK